MNLTQMGDLTRLYTGRRDNYDLKSRLNQLTQELSTGKVQDLPEHLRADQSRLAYLSREIGGLKAFDQTAKQTIAFLGAQQLALGTLSQQRDELSKSLLASTLAPSVEDMRLAAEQGSSSFDAMVTALNKQFAGRALFSGTETGTLPLPSSETIMTALRAAVDFTQDSQSIVTQVQHFFSNPAGGFATLYNGGPDAPNMRSVNRAIQVDIGTTAISPEITSTLSAAAIAAVSAVPDLSGQEQKRAELLAAAIPANAKAARDITVRLALIGAQQGRAEQALSANSARQTSLQIEHNKMVSADPFRTATELHEVERQLETHYMLTARLSKLSLMDHL